MVGQEFLKQVGEERLAKTNREKTDKSRSFLGKVIEGVKTLRTLPSAIFFNLKTLPSKILETAEQMKEADQKRQNEDNLPENDNTNSESQDAPATDNPQPDLPEGQQEMDQEDPSKDAPSEANNTNSESQDAPATGESQGDSTDEHQDTEKKQDEMGNSTTVVDSPEMQTALRDAVMALQQHNGQVRENTRTGEFLVRRTSRPTTDQVPTLQPMFASSQKYSSKSKDTGENHPATPDTVTINGEQNDDDQTRLNASIEQYGDLRNFNSWKAYWDNFSDEEKTESARVKPSTILDEDNFNRIKFEQLQWSLNMANADLAKLHEIERDLNETKDKIDESMNGLQAERSTLSQRLSTIATEEDQLKRQREKVENDSNSVRMRISEQDDERKNYEEALKKMRPQSYDNEGKKQNGEGIVEGAGEKMSTIKPSTFEDLSSKVSSAGENKQSDNFNDPASLTESTGATLPDTNNNLKNPLSGGMSSSKLSSGDGAWKNSSGGQSSVANNELINELQNADIPADTNDDVQKQENENTGLDHMGLSPEQRAKVGLRAHEISQQNDIKFSDALVQARAEFDNKGEEKNNTNSNLDDVQKQENETGLDYMDLDAEQRGALYQRFDEIVQEGNNDWTEALNQAEAEIGIDSDAKGRTR